MIPSSCLCVRYSLEFWIVEEARHTYVFSDSVCLLQWKKNLSFYSSVCPSTCNFPTLHFLQDSCVKSIMKHGRMLIVHFEKGESKCQMSIEHIQTCHLLNNLWSNAAATRSQNVIVNSDCPCGPFMNLLLSIFVVNGWQKMITISLHFLMCWTGFLFHWTIGCERTVQIIHMYFMCVAM